MSANPTRKWSDSWPKEQWQLAHTLVAEAKKSGALIRMPALQAQAQDWRDKMQQSTSEQFKTFLTTIWSRSWPMKMADPLGLF